MRHGNEKITPDANLSEEQKNVLQDLTRLQKLEFINIPSYKICLSNGMTQTDIHYLKIEIELRNPELVVYQRENVLLVELDDPKMR